MQNEWYTPKKYIDSIKYVFDGSISLDPMSCEFAQKVVQADMYYTEEDNGLDKPWYGKVYVNPPYSYPLIEYVIFKLYTYYRNTLVTQAIVLVNGGSSDTKWYHLLLDIASLLCIHKGRIQFYSRDSIGKHPRYTNHFFYLGEIFSNSYDRFYTEFSKYGKIVSL